MINKKTINKLKELAEIPSFADSNQIISYTADLEKAYQKGFIDGVALLAKRLLLEIENDNQNP
jgi:hypothetical protein